MRTALSLRRWPPLAMLGAALVALTVAGLAMQSAGQSAGFVAVALIQGAVYGAAMTIVLRLGASRRVLLWALVGAVALRLILALTPPELSTDIYRYVWDGRVQADGVNPYRYVPAAPELAHLRDDAIYPNINRADYANTIYPPAAQALFFVITRIAETVTAMKLAMIGFEVLALALLASLLRRAGQPLDRLLIFAWNPLTLWEIAGSGHIDAAMIALMCLGLWLRARGSMAGGRFAMAGVGAVMALSVLTKPFPLAVLPALYRRWDWRLPAGFAVVAVLAYLPFIAVGSKVLGFLPTYVDEEGIVSGDAFYPLWIVERLFAVNISTTVYLALAGAALVALAGALAFRRDPEDVAGPSLVLAVAFVFAVSPHLAWYLTWLLPLACLAPRPALVWPILYMTAVSFVLYLPLPFPLTGSIVYGGAAAVLLITPLAARFARSSGADLQEKPNVVSSPR